MATELSTTRKSDELQFCYDLKRDSTNILSELQRKINTITDIPKSQIKAKRDLRNVLCSACRNKSHEILNLPLCSFSNAGCQTEAQLPEQELSNSNKEFLNQMVHILIENERVGCKKSRNEDYDDQTRTTRQKAVQHIPAKGLSVNKGTNSNHDKQENAQNEVKKSISEKIRKLTLEKKELESTSKSQQETIQKLQTKLEEQRSSQTEMETATSGEISQLTSENDELQTQTLKLTSEKDELQTQISKLTSEKDEMQSNLETQQIAVEKLQTALEMKAQEIAGVKKDRDTYHHQQRGLQQDWYQKTVDASSDGDGSQSLMKLQWRSEPKFDNEYLKNLMEEVESYWPLKEMGVSKDALQNVNILLIGPIGAGKSSFLNSVESVFRGHVTMSASASSQPKCVTSAYRQYPITASDNRHYLRFQLCDCRGLDDGNNMNKDIEAILEGHMPDNYTFNISNPMTPKTQGYRKDPKMKDKIHCVVYVLDAEKYCDDVGMFFVTDNVKDQIKDIQEMVDQKGIPQLILLNKVDNVCLSTKQDTSNVYRSEPILQRCLDAGNRLCLPPMTVLPMQNYYMEPSTVDEISILALYNIRQMLRAADTFLRVNHLDELRSDKYESQYN